MPDENRKDRRAVLGAIALAGGIALAGTANGATPGNGDGNGNGNGDDGGNGNGGSNGSNGNGSCGDATTFTLSSPSSTPVEYVVAVDAEPAMVTDAGRFSAGDSGDAITQRSDGVYEIQGSTGSVVEQPYGDRYTWKASPPDYAIVGFEANQSPANYEITINGEHIDPETLPGYEAPPGDDNGDPNPDPNQGIALGGGEGYQNVIHPDEADVMVATRSELDSALSSASSGDVVYVDPFAMIDLGGNPVTVPSGVTLASNRGLNGSTGGLIETGVGSWGDSFYITVESGARVTGLKLAGEQVGESGSGSGNVGLDCRGSGIEVDNCVIFGFSEGGVLVRSGEAHVHHNYIHDCNTYGYGYGVSVGFGSGSVGTPVIEYNYFNNNRHSIEADGGVEDGYVCRFNHFGPVAQHHVVDAHYPAGGDYHVHNCINESVSAADDGAPVPFFGGYDGAPGGSVTIEDCWIWGTFQDAFDSDTHEHGILSGNSYGQNANVTLQDVIPGHPGNADRPWD